ncbi:lipid-A-disaccharide kinase [Oryzisolibacter propanilivorax]|uniref:Tetraacyldisaccharide 4'-kinase n=1 Tax=Oryzisolibacter propanilivorax TaxID=1527607 RepID=A0A1G9SX44_9BURK|nr:tetraacyldisaccharide 4'-kinase [Oryzisolibacter propanilivorax]SDM39972.1 lipid-A-disaccharide kinase [Oryzisolibacter propanilivorax]
MSARLRRAWQRRGPLAWALRPLALLYAALVRLRRLLYARGVLRAQRLPVPVVVVGNVTAGGAGKTPVVLALVQHLRQRGWQPGVISRGYGRQIPDVRQDVREVRAGSSAAEVGDEPLLIARASGVPVFVARQRADAGRALLAAHPGTDILVCDDGLQHLALQRDLEICVFNDEGAGNGWLLPAGPLREPWPRPVDLVLHAGAAPPRTAAPAFSLRRTLAPWALDAEGRRVPLAGLAGRPLRAIAAIARPEDFFALLRASGLQPARCEALPDHYDFDSWKPILNQGETLICTEKDAVKLWPRHPQALAVPLHLEIAPAFFAALDAHLASLSSPQP